MAGITDTGIVRRTFAEIVADRRAEVRRSVDPNLVLNSKTFEGAIIDATANAEAEVWEILEEAYHGFDRSNATGLSLVALAALTGTTRRAPTQAQVPATCNLTIGKSFAANELVAHEEGNPDNRWSNRDPIGPIVATDDYTLTFVCEKYGTAPSVASGKLTEIAESVIGWNSVTNAASSTPGRDLETIEELRARAENELSPSGVNTLGAIVSNVSKLDDVIQVVGFENVTGSTDSDGIPAHSFWIVIWDDGGADNDEVAQAIHDKRATRSYGATNGNAVAYNGTTVVESFDRATEKVVEIEAEIEAESGVTVTASDVKAAILEAFGTRRTDTEYHKQMGEDVIHASLVSSPFAVVGVHDVISFEIRFSGGSLGTSNLSVTKIEIATLKASDITLTGDVS
jgi:uncharacterized phage protein gp47/JayE